MLLIWTKRGYNMALHPQDIFFQDSEANSLPPGNNFGEGISQAFSHQKRSLPK